MNSGECDYEVEVAQRLVAAVENDTEAPNVTGEINSGQLADALSEVHTVAPRHALMAAERVVCEGGRDPELETLKGHTQQGLAVVMRGIGVLCSRRYRELTEPAARDAELQKLAKMEAARDPKLLVLNALKTAVANVHSETAQRARRSYLP